MNQVIGHKGGGKGGGGSGRSPVEDPNTLRSRSTARLIDLISEGPTVGVVGGHKGVYFDNTPLQNEDGTYNFSGVTIHERFGLPEQDVVPGFAAAETEVAINTQITQDSPVTRTVSDPNTSALRVKVQVPRLTNLDADSGDLHGSSVTVAIDIKTATGDFVEQTQVVISGKTTSAYERAVRVELPENGAPWTVRLRRITEDSDSSTTNNETYFSSYTALVDAQLTYPDSALIGLEVDAQQFGQRVPQRTYKYRGLISDVPSNYDPETREYTGIWDGTFKQAWHNNPAWVLYALKTNTRYGVGDLIPSSQVDKFGLYAIGQYCDGLVPDGKGGMEPRYTFNGVLRTRVEAAKALDIIASVFRGMLYWGAGVVMTTFDSPGSPVKLVSPANVIGGSFEYSGTARKTRNSSVAVTWSDPSQFGKSAIKIVQRDDLVQKFGHRQKDVTAVGCTSIGQATRIAEWILFTEENETEVVSYQASLDHADLRPGQIISVADPAYSGIRLGGRIVDSSFGGSGSFTLDSPIDLETGVEYSISWVAGNGDVKTRTILNPPGTGVSVISTSDVTTASNRPEPNAMWVITSDDVAPRQFRVISNSEKKDNIYEITAILHVGNDKYEHVERQQNLIEDDPYILANTSVPSPPHTITTDAKVVAFPSSVRIQVNWDQDDSPAVNLFSVAFTDNDGVYRHIANTDQKSIEIPLQYIGNNTLKVHIASKSVSGLWSSFTEHSFNIGSDIRTPPDVENFRIRVLGDQAQLTWADAGPVVSHYHIKHLPASSSGGWNEAVDMVTDVPARTATVPALPGRYLIKAVSTFGESSENAAGVDSTIISLLGYNAVENVQLGPLFEGDMGDGLIRTDEGVQLVSTAPWSTWGTWESAGIWAEVGDFTGTATFTSDVVTDLGANMSSRVTANMDALGVDLGLKWSEFGTWAGLGKWAGNVDGTWAMTLQIRTTQDDPDSSPTWTDWADFLVGDYQARAFQFRVQFESKSARVSVLLRALNITIDVPDRVAAGEDLVCPASGVQVNFNPAFLARPAVAVNGQSLPPKAIARTTNVTSTGFFQQFVDENGDGVACTFDYVAKGYGYGV